MHPHIGLDGSRDLTSQIYVALREAVLDGRLRAGVTVPASRELARELDVSRGTVTAAYDRLTAEGFLEGRRGAGTVVSAAGASAHRRRGRRRAHRGAVAPSPVWRGVPTEAGGGPVSCVDGTASALPAVTHDLSVGTPDAALFPLTVWRRLVVAQLRQSHLARTSYDDEGHTRLQGEIARYAGLARSVVASGDDVVVTAGAQQAIDLVARVIVEPGAVVAVEDPGYPAAHRLLATHRAEVRGVPVDAEGLVVDALPPRARLVYVTPSHQFPLGVTMSLTRRKALLEWAGDHDAVILEDDYDSEFRFAARPLEPLQSLDRDGRVVYVGSFSKSLLPGLRVGYAIAPASLQPALREAKRVTVWNGDAVTQGALAGFLAEGHHAAHVRRATKIYRRRREVLLEAIAADLADALDVVPSSAGLHVTALLRDPWADDAAIARAARRAGVLVDTLSSRRVDQPPMHGLALGYGSISADAVPEAVARLGRAVREASTDADGRPH